MTRKVAMKGREREKIRVLCIDDEPELLDIMKLYLEKDGDFAVNCVTSPIQALQIINKGGGGGRSTMQLFQTTRCQR